jgi:DNA uptake protein ComE-like DNA-binding protein
MKKNLGAVFGTLVSLIVLSSCSGRDVKAENEAREREAQAQRAQQQEQEEAQKRAQLEERRRQATLGQVQAVPGQSEITTQKRVVVKSRTSIPTIRSSREVADINRMEASHFEALGFSRAEAAEIIRVRQERGGFRSVDDISSIEGLNRDQFERVKPRLGVGPRAARSTG